MSTYQQNEDMIAIGAYKAGNNPKLDEAVSKMDAINTFLKQEINDSVQYDEILKQMVKIVG